MAARICVAQIGAAHGVQRRGEAPVVHGRSALGHGTTGGWRPRTARVAFEIEALRAGKDHLVVRLSGVRDRDAAERLTNLELYVPRERLPPPDAEEFYHADLIGLRAESRDGTELAKIVAVHDFGAGDLLELLPVGERNTVLLPFTTTTVPLVDIAAGRVVIDPPQDLFKSR